MPKMQKTVNPANTKRIIYLTFGLRIKGATFENRILSVCDAIASLVGAF